MGKDTIGQLLVRWLELRKQGRLITPEELCAEQPELLPELRRRIEALAALADCVPAPVAGRMDTRADVYLTVPAPASVGARTEAYVDPAGGPAPAVAEEVRSGPAGWPAMPGYEILAELGRGGMGVVYQARQQGLNRLVALKMILHADHAGPQERARFRAEAEAVARLQHPHIVQVYEVGEHQGCPYFSLELCQGGSLYQRLGGTPLLALPAARLLEALARGIHAAHQKGIVHRDLKPGNVLLTEDGEPKVTDFGLAKQLDSKMERTRPGAIVGTPSYMAPEQAVGNSGDVGPPADIYALGVILYECLTGHPPFKAAVAVETIRQVLTDEPLAPRQLQPGVPRDLETICLKCLQKDPRQRYASALELAEDLHHFLAGEPIRARRSGPVERLGRWCRRKPAWAALWSVSALALVLLLAGGFWYSSRLSHAEAEMAAARQIAATREYFSLLSQVRERGTRRRAGWTWACVEDLQRAATLTTAPDQVAELRTELARCLASVDLRPGGDVAEGFAASCLAYDPQGRWLALGEIRAQAWLTCAVRLLDVKTGETVRTLSFKSALDFQLAQQVQDGTTALAFSADGRWLVAGTRSGWLYAWDLNDRAPAPQALQGHKSWVRQVLLDPARPVMYTRGDDHFLRRWELAAQGWKETASCQFKDRMGEPVLGPAGAWIACHDAGQLLFLDPVTLKPARPALAVNRPRLHASGDGQVLALVEERQVKLLDADSVRPLRELRVPDREVAHEDTAHDLAFSPDGRLLATLEGGTHVVRLWDAVNGRLLCTLVAGGGDAHCLAFRPDGRALAVLGDHIVRLFDVGGLDLYQTVALQTGAVRQIAFHPGGQALACLAENTRPGEPAWKLTWQDLPAEASRPTVLRQFNVAGGIDHGLTFTADGCRLTYRVEHGQQAQDLASGCVGPVVRLPDRDCRLLHAPDGRLWTATNTEVAGWDAAARQPAVRWNNQLVTGLTGRGQITALAPGRHWVVATGTDGRTRLLDARDASLHVLCPAGADTPLRAAALNAAEGLAAVGSEKGEVLFYRVPSGEPAGRLPAHDDQITALAFLDDTLLVTGAHDRSLSFLQWRDGRVERLLTLKVSRPVQALAVSGRKLAVLLQDERAVRLWHLDRLWPRLDALAPQQPLPALVAAEVAGVLGR